MQSLFFSNASDNTGAGHLYRIWCLVAVSYLLLMWLLNIAGGDLWLAGKWYALQGQHWLLRDHWLTEQVLHKGARQLNYLLTAVVLLLTIRALRQYRTAPQLARSYVALALSLLSAFAVVAALKAVTNVACPWSLSLFGGNEAYFSLLQPRPDSLPYSRCFPAGHASVGYAWVALYDFFARVKPSWRRAGLLAGLTAGAVLGLNQQLRGAHFMSHDLTTLLLCLLCSKGCFALMHRSNNNSPTRDNSAALSHTADKLQSHCTK